jgi:OmpA-OmpF porin, OOP family
MKKIILLLGLLTAFSIVQAQLLKKIKDKVDKKVDKTIDDATKEKKDEKENTGENQTTDANTNTTKEPATMKTYSKYDFVPGERIIVFEDFAQDAVGDFPDKWNTNASGEVVTVEGKQGHWFMLTKHGIFMPEFIDSFPDNFTLEFDLMCDNLVGSWGLDVSLAELADRKELENWRSANNSFAFNILPGGEGRGSCSFNRRKMGTGEAANSAEITQFSDKTKPVHVAVWRQDLGYSERSRSGSETKFSGF